MWRRHPGHVSDRLDDVVQHEIVRTAYDTAFDGLAGPQVLRPFVPALVPRADVHALRRALVDHRQQLLAGQHDAAQRHLEVSAVRFEKLTITGLEREEPRSARTIGSFHPHEPRHDQKGCAQM